MTFDYIDLQLHRFPTTKFWGTEYMVTVSESAQRYLSQLVSNQESGGMGVRMFVTQPGTKFAETCLAYCQPEDIVEDDEVITLEGFKLYLEKKSVPYL